MANNDISLTVRLPHELNEKLKVASKKLGITKTNLIRWGIHLLKDETNTLTFSSGFPVTKDRLVLNVNQLTYEILDHACHQYNQSMNATVIAICVLALEHYSTLL